MYLLFMYLYMYVLSTYYRNILLHTVFNSYSSYVGQIGLTLILLMRKGKVAWRTDLPKVTQLPSGKARS